MRSEIIKNTPLSNISGKLADLLVAQVPKSWIRVGFEQTKDSDLPNYADKLPLESEDSPELLGLGFSVEKMEYILLRHMKGGLNRNGEGRGWS